MEMLMNFSIVRHTIELQSDRLLFKQRIYFGMRRQFRNEALSTHYSAADVIRPEHLICLSFQVGLPHSSSYCWRSPHHRPARIEEMRTTGGSMCRNCPLIH